MDQKGYEENTNLEEFYNEKSVYLIDNTNIAGVINQVSVLLKIKTHHLNKDKLRLNKKG